MLSAKDAHTKAKEKNQELLDLELQIIQTAIEKAIENGDYSCSVEHLSQHAQGALENLGYSIQYYSDQRDCESHYTIRW